MTQVWVITGSSRDLGRSRAPSDHAISRPPRRLMLGNMLGDPQFTAKIAEPATSTRHSRGGYIVTQDVRRHIRQRRVFKELLPNPFHLLSPTTRRSILPIRSERSASAALMAAIVCCKVLTFDPSDTIPPSTTAIDPIAATGLDPNKPSSIKSGNAMPPAIAALETNMIFRHRSETSASCSSCASIREISSLGLSSSVRFKIDIQ
jgi:hypothetical protein